MLALRLAALPAMPHQLLVLLNNKTMAYCGEAWGVGANSFHLSLLEFLIGGLYMYFCEDSALNEIPLTNPGQRFSRSSLAESRIAQSSEGHDTYISSVCV